MTASPDYRSLFVSVASWLGNNYGIEVSICKIQDDFTGQFDGTAIRISEEQDDEIRLYVLLHLFGHTVQWNTDRDLRVLGQDSRVGKTDIDLEQIYSYEKNASRLGMAILHEVGVTELDQWLSDWFAADWQFLAHFYRTGESLPYRSTLCKGQPLLEPIMIPTFRPAIWDSRWSF